MGCETTFLLRNSSSWVKLLLYTKNHLPMLHGSALKVSVVVHAEIYAVHAEINVVNVEI